MGVISRRELMGSGIAVSALGFGGHALALEIPGLQSPRPRVRRILIDPRFAEAVGIARTFAGPDSEIIAVPRDVLELWHARLAPGLASAPHDFAGVTTERGFFLLRTLAADQRLSVLSSTVHAAGAHEPLVSWVIGPRG